MQEACANTCIHLVVTEMCLNGHVYQISFKEHDSKMEEAENVDEGVDDKKASHNYFQRGLETFSLLD
jgi:hypothetical protein